jgi:FtsP/CotA-like multicopper oxidase with cupredoxin domain
MPDRVPENPSPRRRALDRRGFLGVAGGSAALLCGLGGRPLTQRTVAEVAQADAAARALPKPASARDPIDSSQFPTPEPQPGGQKREYWIAARSTMWNIAPTGRDEWMNHAIGGKKKFRALVYQLHSQGFASAIGPASMPGPTLEAEVGDTIVVHFRNSDQRFGQALTVHPHGVRYNPEYDGAYLGAFTRAGGFIEPGEEFTYTWEATPDSVGVWPYHDHGPNHTINVMRGLFGAVVIRPKGAAKADVEQVLVMHSFLPQVTRFDTAVQCFNGRVGAGNTPTVRARVGQDVALHVYGGDGNFHTFHVHGHRWKDPSGAFVDCPTVGPNESMTARWREDNPGRWLYHCHVSSHQDAGMAGWYIVEP